MLLGHPETDIGGAGEKAGVGEAQQKLGQGLDPARGEPAAAIGGFDLFAGLSLQAREPVQRRGFACVEAVAARDVLHPSRGGDDGAVTRAAAEIARQRIVDPAPARAFRRSPGLVKQGEKRHDEARRAEAALRTVTIDHGLLRRMQSAVRARQVLDGQQLLAVEGGEKLNAGIDGAIGEALARDLAKHHGAGAAIAFGAALLGAGPTLRLAQVVQHRHGRVRDLDLTPLAPQKEFDPSGHGRLSFPDKWSSRRVRSAAAHDSARRGRRCRSGSRPHQGKADSTALHPGR